MQTSLSKKHERGKMAMTVAFAVICIVYLLPILIVLMNSFKSNAAVNTETFALPNADSFVGFQNYVKGMTFGNYPFVKAVFYSLFITLVSSALILLCTSMAAWYVSRVGSLVSKIVYYLCVFSMVVPFQMVMFTLSRTANKLHLDTPWTIPVIYLGFGAGLAVFMFTGFMKSVPIAIEEAAMIDGCGPFRILTSIIIPMCKPGIVTVCMISAMAAWNEYPVALVMVTDPTKATLPVGLANLYEIQRYATDWGALFAALVLALIPTVILFIVGQKQLVQGLSVGGVKG